MFNVLHKSYESRSKEFLRSVGLQALVVSMDEDLRALNNMTSMIKCIFYS